MAQSACLTLTLLPLAAPALAIAGEPWPFPWPESRIAHYTAHRAAGPIVDKRAVPAAPSP